MQKLIFKSIINWRLTNGYCVGGQKDSAWKEVNKSWVERVVQLEWNAIGGYRKQIGNCTEQKTSVGGHSIFFSWRNIKIALITS